LSHFLIKRCHDGSSMETIYINFTAQLHTKPGLNRWDSGIRQEWRKTVENGYYMIEMCTVAQERAITLENES
jgi:hypothetical protein